MNARPWNQRRRHGSSGYELMVIYIYGDIVATIIGCRCYSIDNCSTVSTKISGLFLVYAGTKGDGVDTTKPIRVPPGYSEGKISSFSITRIPHMRHTKRPAA